MANKRIPGRVMALTAAPMSVVLSEVDDGGDDDDDVDGGGGGGAYKTTVVGATTPSAVTSESP